MPTGLFRARLALRAAGLPDTERLERAPSSANEVWLTDRYVIRITPHPASRRLENEVEVAELLPRDLPYPPIVGYGRAPFGEWLLQRRLPGEVLARAWPTLREDERADAVRQVGAVLRSIHAVASQRGPWGPITSVIAEGGVESPHQLPPSRLLELLVRARALPNVEREVLDDAAALVRRSASALDDSHRWGLVHGDLHFENLLWRDGRISGVLDFEHARSGPPDLDLEVILRFCEEPALHVAEDYAPSLNRRQFRGVVTWLEQAYPALFAHPRLEERIALFSLSYDVPLLLRHPPRVPPRELPPHHPYARIRRIVQGHSPLLALTW